ncbi:MAG: hypothetical protein Fur0046_21810 [Cyanobacteria bacterium J069]
MKPTMSESVASRVLGLLLCIATVGGTLGLFGSVPLIARVGAEILEPNPTTGP